MSCHQVIMARERQGKFIAADVEVVSENCGGVLAKIQEGQGIAHEGAEVQESESILEVIDAS